MSSFGYRPRKNTPASVRFFRLIKKTGSHWEWTGPVNQRGVGKLTDMRAGKAKHFTAPRLSWLIHRGPVPDGMVITRSCDNTSCVNPNHLIAETQAENAAKSNKKRSAMSKQRDVAE